MAFRHGLVAAAAIFAATGLAMAQNEGKSDKPAKQAETAKTELKVGDKAPEITVAKWVKGDPVTGFEKGRTYVVEFWATWCGPCRISIPHLTELQKEYKDIKFVGVSVWETDQAQVEPFVKDEGDQMAYTVAMDDVPPLTEGTKAGSRDAQRFYIKNGKMSKNWMDAAGQHGIPTAFIVDGAGKIAYIGHPMWLEIPLEKISKGTWNAEKGMDEIKSAQEKMSKINEEADDDAKQALQDLDAFAKDYPGAASMMDDLKYRLLVKTNDPRAGEMAKTRLESAIKKHDSQALNEIAWGIVDPESKIENKDFDLAMKAATKAAEFTDRKDPAILDTLAWAYFHKGDTSKAVEVEKEALEAIKTSKQYKDNEQMKDELEGNLKKFQEGKSSK